MSSPEFKSAVRGRSRAFCRACNLHVHVRQWQAVTIGYATSQNRPWSRLPPRNRRHCDGQQQCNQPSRRSLWRTRPAPCHHVLTRRGRSLHLPRKTRLGRSQIHLANRISQRGCPPARVDQQMARRRCEWTADLQRPALPRSPSLSLPITSQPHHDVDQPRHIWLRGVLRAVAPAISADRCPFGSGPGVCFRSAGYLRLRDSWIAKAAQTAPGALDIDCDHSR